MGIKAVKAVRDNSKLSGACRAILFSIATYCNDNDNFDMGGLPPITVGEISRASGYPIGVVEEKIPSILKTGELSGVRTLGIRGCGWLFSINLLFEESPQEASMYGGGDPFYWEETKRSIPVHIKREVIKRDMSTCRYCRGKYEHIDHVLPYSKGGRHTADNLVCSCARCNMKKSARTPDEAGMKLIPIEEMGSGNISR